MFANLVADKAQAAIELFARCVRAELDKAGTSVEVRQALAVLFDNACVRYLQVKNDATTQAILGKVRPRIQSWFLG